MSMTVWHEDAYALTAIGAAACLLQYLDGTIATPGLRCQATAVEPGRFFDDLSRLGGTVSVDGEAALDKRVSFAAGAQPALLPEPAGALQMRVGAVPFAVVTSWSLVTPLTGILLIAIGLPILVASSSRTPVLGSRVRPETTSLSA